MERKETGYEIVGWIHLAQDRIQWRALVNTANDLHLSWVAGNFLTT
jgi:hypothetical protein